MFEEFEESQCSKWLDCVESVMFVMFSWLKNVIEFVEDEKSISRASWVMFL